ncbi:MAG: hypothetical protein GF364_22345 [Candidatus Lokiarchaeota archaeon]|nr:hypothetical protein [Candidatus Lokiarchaeota archaeon]
MEQKNKDDRNRKNFAKITDWMEKWIVFSVGLIIPFHIVIQIILPLIGLSKGFFYDWTVLIWIIEACFYILIYLIGILNIKNRFGTAALIFGYFSTSDVIFDAFTSGEFFAFHLAVVLIYFLMIIGVFGLLFAMIMFLNQNLCELIRIKTYFVRLRKQLIKFPRITKIMFIIFISSGIVYAVSQTSVMERKIKIQPKNYDIKFRVWGETNPEYYQSHAHGFDILDQFNKHNVTIQNYYVSVRDESGNYESFSPSIYEPDKQKIVNNLTWFYNNYPNIRFQYYAYGLGYGSCGNYEGSIYSPAMLKRFVDIMRSESLPNVVGVYTDWEGPGDDALEIANFTMNGWHQALWTDAMAYTKMYFPDWKFSCCFPKGMLVEYLDGDNDLEYFKRYNIFHPYWDDYGPMIYRSCDVDETDEADTSYKVFFSANLLINGMLKGDLSRATMWLGCTGCGPYRNNTIVYEHGEPINFGESKGFDAFSRDILILKHFELPSMSIFLTSSIFESNSRPTGFFDQYGFTDALDRLNETVNGPQSRDPFYIWTKATDWKPETDIAEDFLCNYNRYFYIPVFFGHLALGFLLSKLLTTIL